VSEGPADPFEPDLSGIGAFPPEFAEFVRLLLVEGKETVEALWAQESFETLQSAVAALDEAGAKAALLRLLTHLKTQESGPDWFMVQ
jgi:hypothetical protein